MNYPKQNIVNKLDPHNSTGHYLILSLLACILINLEDAINNYICLFQKKQLYMFILHKIKSHDTCAKNQTIILKGTGG